MLSSKFLFLAAAWACSVVIAQDGSVSAPTSNPQAAGYSCDESKCLLPSCHCASVNPPGGLLPSQVPQFVTVTADDALEVYTIEVLQFLLGSRKNPNGCPPKSTFFNSIQWSNFSMTTDWYVAGNEIADHTMTHVGTPPSSEILGNIKALNAFAGIPVSAIKGFRAPFLNFSVDTLTQLSQDGFLYDSSATSASPANASETDAWWPYTLDNGFANDCLAHTDMCKGKPVLPGLWEIPMYATFETVNTETGIHMMDPWLDSNDTTAVMSWLKSSFLTHYQGNRQPFGLYTHPIHLAINYPGVANPENLRSLVKEFLDWVQTHEDVWFVTNQQLLEWMQDPIPLANLSTSKALSCSTPNVDPSLKICNGITGNEEGLLINCAFSDFPWTTCYGCPVSQPLPANPVPAQNTGIGVRYHLPANCSTPFFDPIKNQCLCESSSCAFTDNTGPITEPIVANTTTNVSSNAGAANSTPSSKPGASAPSIVIESVGLGAMLASGLLAIGLTGW